MRLLPALVLLLVVAMSAGCGFKRVERTDYTPADLRALPDERLQKLGAQSPYLKIHMHDGSLYVLEHWMADPDRRIVAGDGTRFDAMRDSVGHGSYRLGIDSVAIFETNVVKPSGAAVAFTVFVGVTAAVTAACIANPKACFGSCPTFYARDDDGSRLAAEGFSGSIAPSLEATDVDDLRRAAASGDDVTLEMRNEALETHVVRHADLLAVPVRRGGRVFASLDGSFWESDAVVSPASAVGPEGSCLPLLWAEDGKERFGAADSSNLAARETIELRFENVPAGDWGLAIGCRQTLMSTYLLYQAFAYMGNEAGYWFARMERKNVALGRNPIQELLGGIEVLVRDGTGEWVPTGRIGEYGPLATDVHLVPLGAGRDPSRVRLAMTKGNWRIDFVALAALSRQATPLRVHPYRALRDGRPDERARAALADSASALTTLPGDTYVLKYRVPDAAGDYALFLESRGYYLEWIREEWIREENPALLAEMLFAPEVALKRLAPEFKKVEGSMEEHFWSSRYAKQ